MKVELGMKLSDGTVIYTLPEVCVILRKDSDEAIRYHIKKGTLKAHKTHGKWRVLKKDLENFIKRGKS